MTQEIGKGEMTMREAGKLGGQKVLEKYGSDFYVKIGRKGGLATRARMPSEGFKEMGRSGGNALKKKQGVDYFAEIGAKGGNSLRDKKLAENPNYYSEIARMGTAVKRKNAEDKARQAADKAARKTVLPESR